MVYVMFFGDGLPLPCEIFVKTTTLTTLPVGSVLDGVCCVCWDRLPLSSEILFNPTMVARLPVGSVLMVFIGDGFP